MEPGWVRVLGGAGCGAKTQLHQLRGVPMKDRYELKEQVDALGHFMHQWSWDLFITLTVRARFPIPFGYLQSQWHRLISTINGGQKADAYWVRSIENGREQAIPHIHALIGCTAISPREIPRLWHPRTGNAKAEKYDPDRRAAWYLAKDPEAVEFSSNLVLPEKW